MLKYGTQIIYIPSHAYGDIEHQDCERGFVTSMSKAGTSAFCRYWSKHSEEELRTKANSELTPLEFIVVCDTVSQELVETAIEAYC